MQLGTNMELANESVPTPFDADDEVDYLKMRDLTQWRV